MQGLFEIIGQIKQKRGIGVEPPSPKSFSGGEMISSDGCVEMYSCIKLLCNEKKEWSVCKVVRKKEWSVCIVVCSCCVELYSCIKLWSCIVVY